MKKPKTHETGRVGSILTAGQFPTFLSGVALLAGLVASSAYSAPVMNNISVFTENRNATAHNAGGHTLLIVASSVTSPTGVLGVTATHLPVASGPDYALNFVPAPLSPNQYAVRTPYTGQTGRWQVSATDAAGTSSVITHNLNDPRLIPLVSGFAISGPTLTPHLSWNPVDPSVFPSFCSSPLDPSPIYPVCALGTDFFQYQVEIRVVTGTPGNATPLVFSSANFMPTSVPGTLNPAPTEFDIAAGVLSPDTDYLIGIRLNQFDLEQINGDFPTGQFSFISVLENRSVALQAHSTSVPEPSPLLLFATMLAGGLGARVLRRKQAR